MVVCSRRNCVGDTDKMPNVGTDRRSVNVEFSAPRAEHIAHDHERC